MPKIYVIPSESPNALQRAEIRSTRRCGDAWNPWAADG